MLNYSNICMGSALNSTIYMIVHDIFIIIITILLFKIEQRLSRASKLEIIAISLSYIHLYGGHTISLFGSLFYN